MIKRICSSISRNRAAWMAPSDDLSSMYSWTFLILSTLLRGLRSLRCCFLCLCRSLCKCACAEAKGQKKPNRRSNFPHRLCVLSSRKSSILLNPIRKEPCKHILGRLQGFVVMSRYAPAAGTQTLFAAAISTFAKVVVMRTCCSPSFLRGGTCSTRKYWLSRIFCRRSR